MRLRVLILSALLGLVSAAVLAANPAPAASSGGGAEKMDHEGFCQSHAKDCTELAGKFDQWCSANADKCQGLKAFIERRREFCENNKGECKEQREQARADMKEWCSSHADKPRCKAMNEHEENEDENPPK